MNPEKLYEQILDAVCALYGTTPEKIRMRTNKKLESEARTVAMTLCYRASRFSSFQRVAEFFNRKHHMCVINALIACDEVFSIHKDIKAAADKILSNLRKP